MTSFSEYGSWEFTAQVTSSDITRGTAVMTVRRTDGGRTTLVQSATADTALVDRTNYIAVAMTSGEVGDFITCRLWSAGTMPALVDTAADLTAGTTLAWTGAAFEVDATAVHTAMCVTAITGNANAQICELAILKGGLG